MTSSTTPDLEGLRVVVAGGGIGGPAAALLLARAGAEVTVLERIADYGRAGGGYVLQGNGLAVLYGLGMRDRLIAHGRRVDRTFTLLDDGTPLADRPMPDYGDGLDHGLAVSRFHLCGALLEAMQTQPGLELRLGATVVAADPRGAISYETADGTRHELEAELIVGADGVRSVVREYGDFGGKLTRMRLSIARIMAAVEPHEHDPVDAYGERWTRLGTTIGGGSAGGRTYMSLGCNAWRVQRALRRRDLPALAKLWSSVLPAAGRALAELESTDELLINVIDRVTAKRWVDGRLVLLGDAAHAMPPHVGQGANSSLIDAAVLVQELLEARRAGASPELGAARYAARRRPQVERVQRIASLMLILSERMIAPVVRQLRDGIVRLAALRRDGGLSPADFRARSLAQEDPAEIQRFVARVSAPRAA